MSQKWTREDVIARIEALDADDLLKRLMLEICESEGHTMVITGEEITYEDLVHDDGSLKDPISELGFTPMDFGQVHIKVKQQDSKEVITSGEALFDTLAKGEEIPGYKSYDRILGDLNPRITQEFIDEFALRYGDESKMRDILQGLVNLGAYQSGQELSAQDAATIGADQFADGETMPTAAKMWEKAANYAAILMKQDPEITKGVDQDEADWRVDSLRYQLIDALDRTNEPFQLAVNREQQQSRGEQADAKRDTRADVIAIMFGAGEAAKLGYGDRVRQSRNNGDNRER